MMDVVRPSHVMRRGGSTCSSVETIVPGPAFQRNSEAGATSPPNDIDFTCRFHSGHRSKRVRTSQTTSGGAAISISHLLVTGASNAATTPILDSPSWVQTPSANPELIQQNVPERVVFVVAHARA
jgi:hypothetical protein